MKNQVLTILETAVTPKVIELIAEGMKISEKDALERFYRSKTYEVLTDVETGVWHFSPLTLYTMFCEETKGKKISFPTEG